MTSVADRDNPSTRLDEATVIELIADNGVGQAAIDAAVAALVNSAPSALNTLKELADALGDDANFAATITTALAGKQPLDSDLTAIAALTTTSYGRSLLTLADQAALASAAGGAATPTVTSIVQVINNWNGDGNAAFGSAPSQSNRLVANISIQPGSAGVILQAGWNWHLLGSFAGGDGSYCQLWWGDPDPGASSAAALFYTGSTSRHIQVAEIVTNLKGEVVQYAYLPTYSNNGAFGSTFATPRMVPAEPSWCFALCRCAAGGGAIVDAPVGGMASLVDPVLGGFQHGVAASTAQGNWTVAGGNRNFCGATFFIK